MINGWIKLHRQIAKHWIWQDANYLKWWLDILMSVNHAKAKCLIKGKLIECGVGESLYSFETWAERWSTNKTKARRFLKLLEKDGMISLKSETVTTRLTVCKYADYQVERNASETQVKRTRNASETQVKTIEEEREEREEKEDESFEKFWELYDYKKSRAKCLTKWKNLSNKQQSEAISAVPAYVNSTKDKQYRKHPITWLNGECWKDELSNELSFTTYPTISSSQGDDDEDLAAQLAEMERQRKEALNYAQNGSR